MIEWYDHQGRTDDAWRTKAEIIENCEGECIIKTSGTVLHEDETHIIIASESRQDDDMTQPSYRHYMCIYKALVINRVEN